MKHHTYLNSTCVRRKLTMQHPIWRQPYWLRLHFSSCSPEVTTGLSPSASEWNQDCFLCVFLLPVCGAVYEEQWWSWTWCIPMAWTWSMRTWAALWVDACRMYRCTWLLSYKASTVSVSRAEFCQVMTSGGLRQGQVAVLEPLEAANGKEAVSLLGPLTLNTCAGLLTSRTVT